MIDGLMAAEAGMIDAGLMLLGSVAVRSVIVVLAVSGEWTVETFDDREATETILLLAAPTPTPSSSSSSSTMTPSESTSTQ